MFKKLTTAMILAIVSADKTEKKESQDQCIALAMSGGGSKGAYEAGVLYGLITTDTDKAKYEYDVVTGVSAGAINTGAVSVFGKGQESEMVEWLTEKWQQLGQSSVYKQWKPAGIITGVLQKSGIFDNTPLMDFLRGVFEEFGYEIKRKLTVSCVDVNDGSYHLFYENTTDIVKAITSSASIPAIFPHQVWADGVVCMDGGTVWNTNLVSAVQRCREIVDDDSKIILDIIVCDDDELDAWESENNAMSNYLRFNGIKSYHDSIADIDEFSQAFPEVQFRYYITATEPLPTGLGILNFDNTTATFPMQMVGRLDGENAVKSGEGFVQNEIKLWRNTPALKQQYPKLGAWIKKVLADQREKFKQQRRHQVTDEDEIAADEDVITILQ